MNEDWKLTEDERNALGEEARIIYDEALALKQQYAAHGPGGGWADGNNLLRHLGWVEKERVVGHRIFVRLVKPETITSVPCEAKGGELCWYRMIPLKYAKKCKRCGA